MRLYFCQKSNTEEGWLYLARVKDQFTCQIVGYAMGARMTQQLVEQALWRAICYQRPAAGLIHHSDRGSLKNELVHHQRYETRAEAEASIWEYIEIFYNRQRRHSRLRNEAPAVFAQNFRIQQRTA